MPVRNYGQEKRRKEAHRKARQQLKQERRKARPAEPGETPAPASGDKTGQDVV
jgi:hypothetical protein